MKKTADGDVKRLRARLVARPKAIKESVGEDYGLTFAAVTDILIVKVILALGATWRVGVNNGDISNPYVKDDQPAELYGRKQRHF